MTKRIQDHSYAIGITLLFSVVGIVAALHHEMWRDEIQAWLVARDSSSLFDLAYNLKYEGHPALWYLCLYVLTRLTRSPVVMQAFHLLCASATVYVFVRYSPFNRLQKLLFAFGYFPLYEYSIISRSYGIGVLLLFVFATLFRQRYTKTLWVVVVLGLAAHTSMHVLIIVVAISRRVDSRLFDRQEVRHNPATNQRLAPLAGSRHTELSNRRSDPANGPPKRQQLFFRVDHCDLDRSLGQSD